MSVPVGADYLSTSDGLSHLIRILKEEIERLLTVNHGLEEIKQSGLEANMWAASIPPQAASDRLNRYGTATDRAISSAAHELERLQRVRLGVAVSPPVPVDVEVVKPQT